MSHDWDKLLETIRKHEGKPRPTPEKEIAEAERTLSMPLPKTYKELCRKLGPVQWPVYVYGPKAIVEEREEKVVPADSPEFLLFFASDGGEVQYAFDTRRMFDQEYSVTSVDLEQGYEEEGEPTTAGGGFAEWLSIWWTKRRSTSGARS